MWAAGWTVFFRDEFKISSKLAGPDLIPATLLDEAIHHRDRRPGTLSSPVSALGPGVTGVFEKDVDVRLCGGIFVRAHGFHRLCHWACHLC